MKSITLICRSLFVLAGLILCVSTYGAGVNSRNEDLTPSGKGYGEAPRKVTQLNPASSRTLPPSLDDTELYRTGKTGLAGGKAASCVGGNNGINYHNGPILTGTTHIYYIWYGNWALNPTASGILTNLAQKIGGSPRYNINTTYYDINGTNVSNSVTYAGTTTYTYPYGVALSDAQIQTVVSTAIQTNKLPNDTNGVYFVLTSKDVTATSGFCTSYCGWHSQTTVLGKDIKYAFVGDPSQKCPTACEAQTVSPNNNPGADGMASVIVHELEETATDPDFNAWYDNLGWENSDKCAWTFGTTKYASNNSQYNMTLGTLKYLIQQNWVNASGGYCALSF